jgi:hypothetical protein
MQNKIIALRQLMDPLENMTDLKCLAMRVINQNLIKEEIKSRLNLGDACYHSVPNLLSSHLLSEKKKLNKWNFNFSHSVFLDVKLACDIKENKKNMRTGY